MPQLKLNTDCVISAARHSAGDIVTVSDADAPYLLGANLAVTYTAPVVPVKRTKAQIEAELAAAQTTVDQLVKDLAEAEE